MRAILEWFAAHPAAAWAGIPAAALAVLSLFLGLRPKGKTSARPSAEGPTMTPAQGDAARAAVSADARAREDEISARHAASLARVEAAREKRKKERGTAARGFLVALLVGSLPLLGCPRTRVPTPVPLPAAEELRDACEPALLACETATPAEALDAVCDAAATCADLREVAERSLVRLDEATKIQAVDLAVERARTVQAEDERDDALRDRWVWGGVGFALGLVLASAAALALAYSD